MEEHFQTSMSTVVSKLLVETKSKKQSFGELKFNEFVKGSEIFFIQLSSALFNVAFSPMGKFFTITMKRK